MSQEGFRDWLIAKDHNSVTPYVYAINRVSKHYSENSGIPVDIYGITELDTLKGIADKYRQNGIYSEFGFKNAGLHRAAVLKYLEFFLEIFGDVKDEPGGEGSGDGIAANILTYEKDLKSTLCSQVADLFPGYRIFGTNREGIEYYIGGKKIDVLLENTDSGSLLAVELKAGTADLRVFGQISTYLGLLKGRYPDKKIKGVIIAGNIGDDLRSACLVTNLITLKTYKMSLLLEAA